MNADLIRLIIEVVLGLGVIAVSIPYLFSQMRKGKIDATKDLNDTLNDLLIVRDKKIKDLQELVQDQGRKILALETFLHTLNSQKSDLEILVKTALKEHFVANPGLANEFGKSIAMPSLKNV